MRPKVKTFFHDDTFTATHLVWDPETKQAAIVDPVLDYDPKSGRTSTDAADQIVAFARKERLEIEWILETHAHADHVTAAPYLKGEVGGNIGIGERITSVQETFKLIFNAGSDFAVDGSQFDHLFKDGESFRLGNIDARVIHTPGHTPACVTYVIGDSAFVGDTIFMPDYGTARVDFPKGDAATLYQSIQKIFSLHGDTRLFMCHDYKSPDRNQFAWETTVTDEREKNIHVHNGVSEDEFVRMRTERDKTLEMPALILPSVQVNMRAGALPPPEENGVSYLKIPVDQL